MHSHTDDTHEQVQIDCLYYNWLLATDVLKNSTIALHSVYDLHVYALTESVVPFHFALGMSHTSDGISLLNTR